MKIRYGHEVDGHGPGVLIKLTGDEVATAIDAWLVAKRVHVSGPRTIRIDGQLCKGGFIYVDPSGFVINKKGKKLSGRGPKKARKDLQELVRVMGPDPEIDGVKGKGVAPPSGNIVPYSELGRARATRGLPLDTRVPSELTGLSHGVAGTHLETPYVRLMNELGDVFYCNMLPTVVGEVRKTEFDNSW